MAGWSGRKVIWAGLGLSQIPLLLSMLLFAGFWLRRPLIGLIILAAYESFVLFTMIRLKDLLRLCGRGPLDQKVDTLVRWLKVQPEWLASAWGSTFPGNERRYRRHCRASYPFCFPPGLPWEGIERPLLRELHIASRQLFPSKTEPKGVFEIVCGSVWDFMPALEMEDTALAIIGPSGSGKSLMFAQIFAVFAANRQHRYGLRAKLPLLLWAPDLSARIRGSSLSLPDLNPLPGMGKDGEKIGKNDWFRKALEQGRFLILCDGFNEVAGCGDRRDLADWLDRQIETFPLCSFLIGSRPQAYRETPLDRAQALELMPFDIVRAKSFLRAMDISGEGPDWSRKCGARSLDVADFINRLAASAAGQRLAEHPLTLAMAARLKHWNEAVPHSESELFAAYFEAALTRDSVRPVPEQQLEERRNAFEKLAVRVMEKGSTRLPFEEIANAAGISPPVGSQSPSAHSGRTILDGLDPKRRFFRVGRDHVSFVDHTLAEFLVARGWAEGRVAQPELAVLSEHSWWRQAMYFWIQISARKAGQTAADDVLGPIVTESTSRENKPAQRELALVAIRALADSPNQTPHLRALVRSAISAKEPYHRHEAARLMFDYQFDHPRITSQDKGLAVHPITCLEYQRFLDDQREQAIYLQPFHWPGLNFDGDPFDPVLGIGRRDGPHFCRWLNRKSGGFATYRLPSGAEMACVEGFDWPFPALWCQDGEKVFLATRSKHARDEIDSQLRDLCPLDLDTEPFFSGGRIPSVSKSASPNRDDWDKRFSEGLAQFLGQNIEDCMFLGRTLSRSLLKSLARESEPAGLDHLVRFRSLRLLHGHTFGLPLTRTLDLNTEYLHLTAQLTNLEAISDRWHFDKDSAEGRSARLFRLLLEVALTQDREKAKSAWNTWFCALFEGAFRGLTETGHAEFAFECAGLYWDGLVAKARRAGKLPAWEGLAVVQCRNN